MKLIRYLFLFFVFTSALCCQATLERQVINNSGDSYSGAGFSLTYSVGEAVTGTLQRQSVILIEGFIQPVGQEKVNVDFEENNIDIIAYPNPTSQLLTLNIVSLKNPDYGSLSASVVNILGETVYWQAELAPDKHTIDFSEFPSGVYFVIIGKAGLTKRMKVVKI